MSINAYKLLRDLMPEAPLMVGVVASISNGVAVITVPGGGTMQARGETTVSATVFFRDGVIEGPAPSLAVEIITI